MKIIVELPKVKFGIIIKRVEYPIWHLRLFFFKRKFYQKYGEYLSKIYSIPLSFVRIKK